MRKQNFTKKLEFILKKNKFNDHFRRKNKISKIEILINVCHSSLSTSVQDINYL